MFTFSIGNSESENNLSDPDILYMTRVGSSFKLFLDFCFGMYLSKKHPSSSVVSPSGFNTFSTTPFTTSFWTLSSSEDVNVTSMFSGSLTSLSSSSSTNPDSFFV
ncbi:hypothetical protein HanRHA438_Chr04g0176451 [Helianthus annuus]|nr:hypothetical protein HanRHA438_Chr04g0176451 [Helianthus annuus]